MAYEKTTWATGDVITAEKLNHAETGIETANETDQIAVLDPSTGELDASYNDVVAMVTAGRIPFIVLPIGESPITNMIMKLSNYKEIENGYAVQFSNASLDGTGQEVITAYPFYNHLADAHLVLD